MAQDLLKGGLNAGSGYSQVWIRDLNTFINVALEVNPPARFREALLTFFKFQGTDGDIVDGYVPLNPAKVKSAFRTSSLATNLMAFKNSVETDQESSLVQAVFKYVCATHDETILAGARRRHNCPRTSRPGIAICPDRALRPEARSGLGRQPAPTGATFSPKIRRAWR